MNRTFSLGCLFNTCANKIEVNLLLKLTHESTTILLKRSMQMPPICRKEILFQAVDHSLVYSLPKMALLKQVIPNM